jgi:hypothetical protein
MRIDAQHEASETTASAFAPAGSKPNHILKAAQALKSTLHEKS